jgi:hypothetical protein
VKILVLFVVKLLELVPPVGYRILQPSQTIQDCNSAEILARDLPRVDKWIKFAFQNLLERLPSLLRSESEAHYQEGGHKEACVRLLGRLRAAMVKNLDSLVFLVLQDTVEL